MGCDIAFAYLPRVVADTVECRRPSGTPLYVRQGRSKDFESVAMVAFRPCSSRRFACISASEMSQSVSIRTRRYHPCGPNLKRRG